MNWKPFILGAAIGMIGGFTVKKALSPKVNVSPENVLVHVKAQFKEHGPITGSWIENEPKPYEKAQMHYTIYKGGISKNESGANKQYEFLADAATGTILEIHPLAECDKNFYS